MAAQRFDDPQPGFAAADEAASPRAATPSRRPWGQVLVRLRTWWRTQPGRRAELRELARLSDHLLRDIGIDPGSVPREPMPPTWDPWRG